MKFRNRMISAVLVALMLIPAVNAYAEAEKQPDATETKLEMLFEDNFSGFRTGATGLSGYTNGNTGNKILVCEEETANKYVLMSVISKNHLLIAKDLDEEATGKLVIDFKISLEDTGNVQKQIMIVDSKGTESILAIFHPGSSFTAYDGTVISGYMTQKWYDVSFVVDTDAKTYDAYFNGKRRMTGKALQKADSFSGIKNLRFHMRYPNGESTMLLDDVRIYTSDRPLSADELADKLAAQTENEAADSQLQVAANDARTLMTGGTALYVNKPNALMDNVKTYITPQRDVMPFYENGHVVVPLRFFSSSIGGETTWNSEDSTVALTKGDICVTLKVGENCLMVNGHQMALPVPVLLVGGTTYASIAELCDAFGLYLFLDQSGMVIYSENNLNLSWQTHLAALRSISESYVYDDVEGSEITALLRQNFPNQKHPRLVMTEDKFAAIRAEYSKGEDCDPVYKELFEMLQRKCDGYLNTTPMTYTMNTTYYLIDVGRAMNDRIMALAMMYNITLDERYAIRARQELIAAATFPNWNQTFMLACSEMAVGVAFGYDWLYDWLDESDRALLRKSLVNYAIAMVQYDYDNATVFSAQPSTNPIHRAWDWRGGNPTNNQIIVINGAMFSAAAAVADELTGNELVMAERVFSQSLVDLRRGLSLFAPDGGYEESMGYWEFCQEFCTYHLGTLLNITGGEDYGYLDAPGTRSMVDFLICANGPVSAFSYHDTTTTVADIPPQSMFWADVFGDYEDAIPRIEHIMAGKGKLEDLYFYKPEFNKTEAQDLALDYVYPTTGIASMRNGWGNDDLWIGFHADNAYGGPGHAHMDVGSFVMDAMGHQYFLDLGQDSYSLGGAYYIHAYRFRAEGHNTIVINPDDGYDQKYGGKAKIDKWVSKPQGVYAQTNLTDIYSDDVESAWRGIKLDNYRRTVTVQDEIVMKEPSEFYWFAHTAADIQISEDGKKAYLQVGDDILLAEIATGDGAVFSVMDAKPLPTTPDVAGQNQNKGIQKLTIHMENVREVNLQVVFNQYDADYDENNYSKEFIPLTAWEIPDGENDPDYAKLNAITINGAALEGFDPDKYHYTVKVSSLEEAAAAVDATADGGVEITPSSGIGSPTLIKACAHNGKTAKHYTVTFVAPEGEILWRNEIKPVSVSANDNDGNIPENTLDGDMETRWSSAGVSWIKFDLGSVQELEGVAIAFWKANERVAQYSIEVSENGENWLEYFTGDASVKQGFNTHYFAGQKVRYIRINCRGFDGNENGWNSVLEVKTFVK